MKPTVILQFRKLGSEAEWIDLDASVYTYFEHERHLAEEKAEEINVIERERARNDPRKLYFEYRVKP